MQTTNYLITYPNFLSVQIFEQKPFDLPMYQQNSSHVLNMDWSVKFHDYVWDNWCK